MEPIDFDNMPIDGHEIRELIVETTQLLDQLQAAPQLYSKPATRAWMAINIQSAMTPVHKN